MLPPSPIGLELITLLFDQFNGNSETKHSTATTTPSTHSSTAHDSEKATDSTPKLGLSWHSTAPSYPTRHYPRPTTNSLEAWISAEPTILRCISDANDDHIQTNPIDDYFPRLRDG
jgi:hypothetical protein